MAARRAVTEGVLYDDDSDDLPIDLNELDDDDVQNALAMAYAMQQDNDDDDNDNDDQTHEEDDEEYDGQDREGMPADSDVDDIDYKNFKGIYFNDDPNRKYQCPETGAHFEYYDLCKRMTKLKELRRQIDKELGLETISDTPKQTNPNIKDKKAESTRSKQAQASTNAQINNRKSIGQGQSNPPIQLQQNQGNNVSNTVGGIQQSQNQVTSIQRRQIRGYNQNDSQSNQLNLVVGGVNANSQFNQQQIQQQQTENMKIDWLSGKNIQNYINELKQKMGVNNNFRSKSHEKVQNLLVDKNQSQRGVAVPHHQQQQQQLFQNQQQNLALIQQILNQQNQNQQQHRKKGSQHQQSDLKKLHQNQPQIIVSGSNKDLLINKSPDVYNKKSKRNDLVSAGAKRASGGVNAYSLERKNFEPMNDVQNLTNAYNDHINQQSAGRQFRNSNYSSSATKQQPQIIYNQQQMQSSIQPQLQQQIDTFYKKAQGQVLRQSQQTAYGNGKVDQQAQKKTRNSQGFSGAMSHNNQSNSITHSNNNNKIMGNDELSPYFVKQKQPSNVTQQSQKQTKKKAQLIIDSIDMSGGIVSSNNQYSRNNRGGIHDVKTSYSQKTQDLLQSVQRSSNLINSIKNGKNLLSSAQQKRVTSGNMNYRKSFGVPAVTNGSILQPSINHHQQSVHQQKESITSSVKVRPQTSGPGKVKQNSQDQRQLALLGKNDRSRQPNISSIPSNQLQKSFNNGASNLSMGGGGSIINQQQLFYHNAVVGNQYFVNKSIGSFKS